MLEGLREYIVNIDPLSWCVFANRSPDPMHGSNQDYMENIREYLCDEYARLNEKAMPWQYKKKGHDRGASFPRQADSSSCGVYTCLYANRRSLGLGLETIESIHGASRYRMYLHSLFFPFLKH
jgi:Ulp1 family protease